MAPTLKDIIVSAGVRVMLEANGRDDCNRGIDMREGWREICQEMGFDTGRTPAREAYEDGYYSGIPPKNKE